MSNAKDVPMNKQEQYWDMWQEARSINSWAQRRAEILLNLLRSLNLQDPKILDFGCGNGWFCPHLAKYGEVTGIDLSKENMRKAQEETPEITFIGADVFTHPLPTNHFDVIVSQQVIAHVNRQSEYVDRCASLLRDRGHLILSTNNKFVMDRLRDEYVDDTALGHIENWLSMKELENLIKPQFDLVARRSIIPRGHGGVLRLVNSDRLNALLRRLFGVNSVERLKEKLGLGYVNIILARKR